MSSITKWQSSRNESFLFVRVRKGGYQFTVHGGSLLYHTSTNIEIDSLPEHTYALTLDIDNATEEQAALVVVPHAILKYKFRNYDPIQVSWADTAVDSLSSLVRSLNLDPNYNYVVLKIEQ